MNREDAKDTKEEGREGSAIALLMFAMMAIR